jgi:hypothetical protein
MATILAAVVLVVVGALIGELLDRNSPAGPSRR